MDSSFVNKSGQASSSNGGGKDSFAKENPSKSNAIEIPSISLPKGGGAIKGIDEKFQVNAANGTAGFSIPLPVTPGRNGFAPSFSLSYNSGSGNGPFGLGWDIGLPSIQRRTDKKLPRYRNAPEEDVFMFSGVEDLVPFLYENNGAWGSQDLVDDGYTVKRYRPRVEGNFSRIEKITSMDSGTYWKVTTRENVVSIFGRTELCRIADPDDAARIFKWLPELSYDDKGNWMSFEYKTDTNTKPELREAIPSNLSEQNRKNGIALFINQYLKRIKYGNRKPYYADDKAIFDPLGPADKENLFELVFDYGDHDLAKPLATETDGLKWDYRFDAFSNFHSGFEIRTARLCRRILMFHHFEDEKQADGTDFGINYLVRSLDLDYIPSSVNNSGLAEFTYLNSITQSGYIRKSDGTYSKKSLPKMEFEYQQLVWNKDIKQVSEDTLVNAPVGLTNNYQWVDFYGEGVSGIFTEQHEGWYYKENLGIGKNGDVQFSPAKTIALKPSFTGINSGVLQLRDLDANGEKQLVINTPDVNGFFQLTADNDWEPFHSFLKDANINLNDPFVRTLDLNGDGMPELVMTEENVFVWYASEGKNGYSAAEFASKTFDEETGPAVVFAESLQTIFLADMSGDGMTDIVRIRNGEICYWPNMGYGKFGARVNMDNAPLFDSPDLFNPEYLHLADVSGTGTTDIIYTGKNKSTAYLNLSGNQWSKGDEIETVPSVYNKKQISVIDLLGTGTSCLVWSSDLPGDAWAPMRYIDLMNSKKPHVMIKHINNMGKETSVEYKSSAWFFLKDKLKGKPWITRLPFPVQVVYKTTIEEKITNVQFTTEYSYHHGYYDHAEKEFRGFGRVEQIDTENYETWQLNTAATSLESDEDLYQSPVLAKTWFHTGAYLDKEKILTQFETEYWYNELQTQGFAVTGKEPTLPDAQLNAAEAIADKTIIEALSAGEWREALRACKGMILRQEVFALDAPVKEASNAEMEIQLTPYSVATHNFNIQLLQPRGDNPYAVFISNESESINFHYERNIGDPRIAHTLNVQIDGLGNPLQTASVVYGRDPIKAKAEFDLLRSNISDFDNDAQVKAAFIQNADFAEKAQQNIFITYTSNLFTNDFIPADNSAYKLRMLAETMTYELTGFAPANGIFQLNDFAGVLDTINPMTSLIAYQETADPLKKERRLIEDVQTIYYNADLSAPLPLGQLNTYGFVYQNYQLAFTPAMLNHIYGAKLAAMPHGAGYLNNNDSNWWIPSGSINYKTETEKIEDAKTRFFAPLSFEDPFGTVTLVNYYRDYFLIINSVEDNFVHNKTQVEHFNFRSLSPAIMRDINDNLSAIISDELGLVKATALLGKDLNNDGKPELEICDNLTGLSEITDDTERNDIQSFFQIQDSNQMDTEAKKLIGNATTRFLYDLEQYTTLATLGKPTVVATILREEHAAANPDSKLQCGFAYSDGLGKIAMNKVQASPGIAKKLVETNGAFTVTDIDTSLNTPKLRWIGNGRTVLNNKGNPVKQYEPYFSIAPFYEDQKELVETGVTPIIYYDSLGRNVKTAFPDETFSTVEFNPWKQFNYDQNDNVITSGWYIKRTSQPFDSGLIADGKDPLKETDAANKAAKHNNTPEQVYLDALGRPILSIADNGKDINSKSLLFTAVIDLDIEGNARKITDARGNKVMEYQYDMLGHRVYHNSMDAGERWMLNNVMGNPVLKWDSRNQVFSFRYDALHRPVEMSVSGGEDPANPLNNVFEKINYGEDQSQDNQTQDKLNNLRGRPAEHFDTAGKLSFTSYDLKGNLLTSSRQLADKYKEVPDWGGANVPALGSQYSTANLYDALNRVTSTTAPDNSITTFSYNQTNLLNTVNVEQNEKSTSFVTAIDYNEKGQRRKIVHGNNLSTGYEYDKNTFRLIHLGTQDGAGNKLQDLYYTFDPIGNITQQEDKCIPTKFFNNYRVDGISLYEYNALYQLSSATGRECKGQLNYDINDNWGDFPFLNPVNPGGDVAWQQYKQTYQYDPAGNIRLMDHKITDQSTMKGWTRNYTYETTSNRLLSTVIAGNAAIYKYPCHPQHGFITGMPHLSLMQWNFKDELQATAKQVVNAGNPPVTWYVYDAQGQRIRKVTESSAGNKISERIYLGSVELYFEYNGAATTLQRNTLHVMDDKQRIAMVETLNTEDGKPSNKILVRYQFNNHLGSASLEVNDDTVTPQIISYEEYHPYGTTAYQAINTVIKAAAKRYRYTGLERDEETGFGYHSARYYLPWLGRWASCDPIEIRAGFNMYCYVCGNPISFFDKMGHDKDESVHETRYSFSNDRAVFKQKGKHLYLSHVHKGRVKSIVTYGSDITIIKSAWEKHEELKKTVHDQAVLERQKFHNSVTYNPIAIKGSFFEGIGGGFDFRRDEKGNLSLDVFFGLGVEASLDLNATDKPRTAGGNSLEAKYGYGMGPAKAELSGRASLDERTKHPLEPLLRKTTGDEINGSADIFGLGIKVSEKGATLKGASSLTRLYKYGLLVFGGDGRNARRGLELLSASGFFVSGAEDGIRASSLKKYFTFKGGGSVRFVHTFTAPISDQ